MAETETTIAPLTLDKQQAADALNVPPDTLLNLTRTGQLASIQVGKHRRWLIADLQAFIEAQRAESQACTGQAG